MFLLIEITEREVTGTKVCASYDEAKDCMSNDLSSVIGDDDDLSCGEDFDEVGAQAWVNDYHGKTYDWYIIDLAKAKEGAE